MTAPKWKKTLRDIIANNPRADKQYGLNNDDDDAEQKQKENMLYDAKDLVKRMKTAYQKRKREKKIDALKNSDSLWRNLE